MATLAEPAGRFRRPLGRQPPPGQITRPGGLTRALALVAFTGLLAANVALNSFKIGGVPIRGIVAAGLLGLLVILYWDITKLALKKNLLLLGFATGLAVLGIIVSVVNNAPVGSIIKELTEIHIQAAVTIMVTAILAHICGPRACVVAIVAVVGISACAAVAQMLDIHSAWTLRRSLGPLPNELVKGLALDNRRPVGLSFSAIQLSTQLCLAFAAYLAVREKMRRGFSTAVTADPAVIFALFALIAASVANGTRSPILGGLIFLALYAFQRRTPWLPIFLILAGIVFYLAWPLIIGVLETHSPRVTSADDNSANARGTLAYYGWRLFADNPVGYGLTFAPMTLWTSYWPDLYTMPAPRGVQRNDLHNYLLSMLNIYGIGILLLAPLVAKLLRRASASIIFFVPYIVQILFHNAGPFYNDSVIWFATAAIAAAVNSRPQPQFAEGIVSPYGDRTGGLSRLAQAMSFPLPNGRANDRRYRRPVGRLVRRVPERS